MKFHRLIVCLLVLSASSIQAADKPNVLFIAVDDLRVELGCYGNTIVKSPNIDRLAKRGYLFKRAYCQQAVCNPSRASLLTGMRPDAIGVIDLPTHFRESYPDIVTLPQLFKQNGYHAQNIGKIFHNWRQDGFKGDPKSWSEPAVMHYASHSADTPKVKGEIPPNLSKIPRTDKHDVPDDAYFDGRIANLAVDALGKLKAKPFFLAVGFWKPHAPFNAPKKYWDLYDLKDVSPPSNPTPPKDVPEIALHDSREILRGFKSRFKLNIGSDGLDIKYEYSSKGLKTTGRKPPTAQEVLVLRQGYYAATSYVDAQIGKVLDELYRLKLEENTIVVFWSDHGFHLGEHGLWGKTSNFELDARVPMIISLPGQNKSFETDSLVELLDIYPTLTDLCGLNAPEELQGKSLNPIFKNLKAEIKPYAFTQHTRPAYPSEKEPLKAMGYSIRSSKFRYTRWEEIKTKELIAEELYNHSVDPDETVNLANSEKWDSERFKLNSEVSKQIWKSKDFIRKGYWERRLKGHPK